MKKSDVEWRLVASRNRVFNLPDGVLITSKKTVKDLPIQNAEYWEKIPEGLTSIERFHWRQEHGLSSVSPAVRDVIEWQERESAPRWKKALRWLEAFFIGT